MLALGSKLEALPERPPTPPTSSVDAKKAFGNHALHSGNSTPSSQSHDIRTEPLNRSMEKGQKKVGFAQRPEYKEPPKAHDKESALSEIELRTLTPSGGLKPVKSILKPYSGITSANGSSETDKLAAPHKYANFAAMLESIVRQLATEDRSCRIDAYVALCSALRASGTITADAMALKDKMGLLTQFIKRDLNTKHATGAHDSVSNHAIILLSIFVRTKSISDIMPHEFQVYVIDLCIMSFEEGTVTKEVMKHFMGMISVNHFSPRVMTPEKSDRLLASISAPELHVGGRSVVILRLQMFQRILGQSRNSLVSNRDWLEILFSDVSSSLKDIQSMAIAFGLQASLELGTEKHVSKAVMELFEREVNGVPFADLMVQNLKDALQNKQEPAVRIPKIWSIVILFLRYRPVQFEQWEYIKPWIQVLQLCFNHRDYYVKEQANFAWNRLVFALQLDEKTPLSLIKMLSNGIGGQLLKRRFTGKYAKDSRRVIMGGVCNLIYYGLKPASSTAQLDLYWDQFVEPNVGKILVTREDEPDMPNESLDQACAILSALFDTTPRPWQENRANEDGKVSASELPSVDPKWIRRNAQRVFQALGPLIEKRFWDLTVSGSSISTVWKHLISCVASAGIKEVKVSNDTMNAVAHVFNLLFRLWQQGPNNTLGNTGDADSFEANISFLIGTTIASLGVLPFTEKLLSIGPHETFAIVATPSQTPTKYRGSVKSPLFHLFGLIAEPPAGLGCDKSYVLLIESTLTPFFKARTSQRSKIDLLRDLSFCIPQQAPDSKRSSVVWNTLALCATEALSKTDQSSSSSGSSNDQLLGTEFRHVVKFLEMGITFAPEGPSAEWLDLFNCTANMITRETGDSGRAIMLLEPLSRMLSTHSFTVSSIAYCSVLVASVAYPRDKQALEAARRRLWAVANPNSTSASFDPFSELYTYMEMSLTKSYTCLEMERSEAAVQLLVAVTKLIRECSMAHIRNLLVRIQEGLGDWIKDDDLKYRSRFSSTVASSVVALWENLCTSFSKFTDTDSSLLRDLESLMCSGFDSKHQLTVSQTITCWNSTFGSQAQLEYPSKILVSLNRLRSIADLQLPSFPKDLHEELMSDGPILLDTQEDELAQIEDHFDVSNFSRRLGNSPALPSLSPRAPQLPPPITGEAAPSRSRHLSVTSTPDRSNRTKSKKAVTPRLRHDDSQIQFAPIESSPLDPAAIQSQILTDRQREVKERQAENSAMFPDLRSNPMIISKVKPSTLPTILSDSPGRNIVHEKPTTPAIAGIRKGDLDEYAISSPTPRRGQVNLAVDSDDFDPPSSPPERLLRESTTVPKLSFTTSIVDDDDRVGNMWDVISFSSIALPDLDQSLTDLGPSAQIDPLFMSGEKSITSLEPSVEAPKEASLLVVDKLPSSTPSMRPSTPGGQSVFLDAFSSPIRPSDEVFVDAQSSPGGQMGSDTMMVDDDIMEVEPTAANEIAFYTQVQEVNEPITIEDSSPVSYMDEESLLRLAETYDDLDAIDDDNVAAEKTPEPTVIESSQKETDAPIIDPESSSDQSDTITMHLVGWSDDKLQKLRKKTGPSKISVEPTRTTPINLKRKASSGSTRSPLKDLSGSASQTRTPSPAKLKAIQNSQISPIARNESQDIEAPISQPLEIVESAAQGSSGGKKRRRNFMQSVEVARSANSKRRRTSNISPAGEDADMTGAQNTQSDAGSKKKAGKPKGRKNTRRSGRLSTLSQTSSNADSSELSPQASKYLDDVMQDEEDSSFQLDNQDANSMSQSQLESHETAHDSFDLSGDGNLVDGENDWPMSADNSFQTVSVQEIQATTRRMEKQPTTVVFPRPGLEATCHLIDPALLSNQPPSLVDEETQDSSSANMDVVQPNTETVEKGADNGSGNKGSEEAVVAPESIQASAGPQPENGAGIISRFRSLLSALSTVSFTRKEARELEDLSWDLKGALAAAERRGREKEDQEGENGRTL